MRHKPAIGDEDLKKLKTSQAIALTSALTLLQSVWFHVVLFFCRRGREGQKELKRSSFKFKVDASGRKFVTMAHDEATKNHPGGLIDVSSHETFARMYETPEKKRRLQTHGDLPGEGNIRISTGSTMKLGTIQHQLVSTNSTA